MLSWSGNGNPLQYSCLENSVDRGAWRTTVHRVTESDVTERARRHAVYYAEAFDEVLWASQNSGTDELPTVAREGPPILPTPDSRQQPGRTGQLPLRTGI